MTDVTVKQFAEVVGVPSERLLAQLVEAGMEIDDVNATISESQKSQLLDFLRESHGKSESDATAPRQVTLKRRSHSELRIKGSGPRATTKTVNVEFRKKRTYVKRDALKEHHAEDAEREAARKALEEARAQREAEAQREKEEQEARSRQQAEEAARAEAEDRARKEQEEQARREAEEQARQAEEQRLAEEKVRQAEELLRFFGIAAPDLVPALRAARRASVRAAAERSSSCPVSKNPQPRIPIAAATSASCPMASRISSAQKNGTVTASP